MTDETTSNKASATRRQFLWGAAGTAVGFGVGSVFGYRLAGIQPSGGQVSAVAEIAALRPVAYTDGVVLLPMDAEPVGKVSDALVTFETFAEPCPTGAAEGLTVAAAEDDTFVALGWDLTQFTTGPIDLQSGGLLGLWFYLPETLSGRSGATIVLSSDAAATNNRQMTWTVGRDIDFGWNLLLVDPLGQGPTEPGMQPWTVEGADPIGQPIVYMQLRLFGLQGAPRFHLGGLFHYPAPLATPAVLLGYDGIHNSLETLAKPALDARALKAYVSVDAEAIEQNADDSAARMHRFYDAGWDVIPCGMFHTNYGEQPELISEHYDEAVRRYSAAGFERSLRFFTYPRNGYTPETDRVLREKGVVMARQTFERSIVQTERWPGRLVSHGSFDLGGQTLQWAKNAVDHAVRYGTTVEIFVHRLREGGNGGPPPEDLLEWYTNDYAALLDYIASRRDGGELLAQIPSEWARHRGLLQA